MFAAWVLGAFGLLVVATPALFLGGHRPASVARSAVVAVLTAAAAGAVLRLAGVGVTDSAGAAAFLAVGQLAWLPLTRRWATRGNVVWGAAVSGGAAYLLYVTSYTLRSRLGAAGTAAGLLLVALEALAFLLGLVFLWECVEVLALRSWQRRSAAGYPGEPDRLPFVSLHVPAHNEPPEMVTATLTSLLALDYPAYEIILIDDNTADPELWRPVEAFCQATGVAFHHLQDWPGYKSGALNFALTVTDPRAEVIGVVDSDYLVDADYLRRCAPYFLDPAIGFLQTPQDYREWAQARYFRRLYYSYAYFFAVSQASRNERDGAIFGGTMGLIRRAALEQVGGWDEWCITEDAELSLRLLRAGWSGQHVERAFGRGVMPLTFEALKKQRFRWCFGGAQILKMHWRTLLPWDRSADNHLSQRQRYAYASGALQWYGDALGLLFAALLIAGALNLAVGSGFTFRRLSGLLLVLPPAAIGLGVLRTVGVLRERTGAGWRDAAGAFVVWLALGWTVAQASIRGLVEPQGVFLRTPKVRGDASWRDALRANPGEAIAATVLLASAALLALRAHGPAAYLLVGLLAWQAAGLLAAPVLTVAALRAELSDELRRRRRTEWLRDRVTSRVRPLPVGATVLGVTVTGVLAVLLLAPGSAAPRGPLTDLFRQAHDKPPAFTTPTAPRKTNAPTLTPRAPSGRSGTTLTASASAPPSGAAGAPSRSPGVGSASPTAQATPSPTPTPTPTPTPSPTPSPSASRPTPSHPPTATSRPTPTPSPSTTRRPSSSPSPGGGRPSATPSR